VRERERERESSGIQPHSPHVRATILHRGVHERGIRAHTHRVPNPFQREKRQQEEEEEERKVREQPAHPHNGEYGPKVVATGQLMAQ